MKRIFKLAILTMVIALLTACNNVNKPTYNGDISDNSLHYSGENSELASNSNSSVEADVDKGDNNTSASASSSISSDSASSTISTGASDNQTVSDSVENYSSLQSASSSDDSAQQGAINSNTSDTVTSTTESTMQSGQEVTSSTTVSSGDNISQSGSSVVEGASSVGSSVTSGSADGHTHQFKGATCTEPKICLICGATEGEPKHRWKAATCIEPKTCIACEKQEGELAEHIYIGSECNVCHQRNPDFEYVPIESTNWVAHIVDESVLYRVVIDFKSSDKPSISHTTFNAISETAECEPNLLYLYNGQRYATASSSEQSGVTVKDKTDTIEIRDNKDGKIVLERVLENNLVISKKVKKFVGYEKFLTKGATFVPLEDE